MNRIGLKVIGVSEKVTVTENGNDTTVKEPKGEFTRYFDPYTILEQKDEEIHFSHSSEANKTLHGIGRANLASMIEGVTDEYVKKLTLVSVGYRAAIQDKELTLDVGYSHPVVFEVPKGVTVRTPSATSVGIEDISKQVVSQFAAETRDVRPPEPYKGKGIRYGDGYIRRKEGRTGK